MRAAVAHGDAEALGAPHGDIRPPPAAARPFAGGFDEGEGEQIGRGDDQDAVVMGLLGEGVVVFDSAVGAGVCRQDAAGIWG